MKKNILLKQQYKKEFVRQTSQEQSSSNLLQKPKNDEREMRQMKSVNKLINLGKNHFFFQEGQKTIGIYKFDTRSQIGSGYSSKVYKAVSLKDGSLHAIKAIELKKFKSSQVSMLQTQIEILRKMNHPNIVKFQDVHKSTTHIFIVTEYCSKGDLMTYMTRQGNLNQKQAIQIFADILEGLKYLIKLGIIHRDIKPGNILFNGEKWKLADFGFALQSNGQELKTKNNMGTPLYMPLQSLVQNTYSASSDIFALGILLYEMLFRITPWECRSEQQLLQKLKKIPFKIPAKAKISQETRNILKKMCQNDRSLRMTKHQLLDLCPEKLKGFNSSQKSAFKYDKKHQQEEIQEIQPLQNCQLQLSVKQVKKQTVSTNIVTTKNKLNKSVQNQSPIQLQTPDPSSTATINLTKTRSQSCSLNTPSKLKDNDKTTEIAQRSPENLLDNSPKEKENFQKSNRNIMIWALNMCRFMYYLNKNSNHIDINKKNTCKLRIVLFRHAITIMRQFIDTNINWFRLDGWDTFKGTRNYEKILNSYNEYLAKYSQEYNAISKKIDQPIICETSQQLVELFSQELLPLNNDFYQRLSAFIAPILRENNHNLAIQVCNKTKTLTEEIKQRIYSIHQLYEYYILIKELSKQNMSYQQIESQKQIQIVKTYAGSNFTREDFMNLRKKIKYV